MRESTATEDTRKPERNGDEMRRPIGKEYAAGLANILGCVAINLGMLTATTTAFASPLPDPNAYRRLDDRQLGHIDWIVTVANRPGGDWTEMGAAEPGQGGFDSYRYQLAMMSYTLDLANYHYTPAYRELYQAADRALIDKMLREDVWGFWELTSRGSKMFDPDLQALGDGWIDPIKEQNIMYSGHLFQMVATHAMLFNDPTFEQPGGIQLVYDPVGRGLGKQVFSYTTRSLADTLYRQFERSEWRGIECEPNAIFPECNQHPILGYRAMEARAPTGQYEIVSRRFKAKFDAMKYIDPKTKSFMGLYLKRQDKMVYDALPWSDGWAGAFMHAWSKADVEAVYPIQRANYLTTLANGAATVKIDKPRGSYSHDHGFFAVLAAEVGDERTKTALLAYADAYWNPKWDADGLRYPRYDAYRLASDPPHVWRRVQVLTGNALIGLARIDVGDGLYTLYSKPRSPAAFDEPFISDIDNRVTKVARAVYDPANNALIVTLRAARALPGNRPLPSTSTRWTINNLTNGPYDIRRDGALIATVKDTVATSKSASHDKLNLAAPGRLTIVSDIDEEATYIVTRTAPSLGR